MSSVTTAKAARSRPQRPLRTDRAFPTSIPFVNIATADIVPGMLPTASFHILLALADEDRHGYAIIQEVAMRTGGELRLSAGTLYRSIQRLLEQGLIVETRDRPAPADDEQRRRYYRITPEGTAAAREEARRLAQLVKMARAKGLAPGRA